MKKVDIYTITNTLNHNYAITTNTIIHPPSSTIITKSSILISIQHAFTIKSHQRPNPPSTTKSCIVSHHQYHLLQPVNKRRDIHIYNISPINKIFSRSLYLRCFLSCMVRLVISRPSLYHSKLS